jgi:hypothetical protein
VAWRDKPEPDWLGPNNTVRDGEPLWQAHDHELRMPKDLTAPKQTINLARPWTMDGVSHAPLPGMRPATPGRFGPTTPPAHTR